MTIVDRCTNKSDVKIKTQPMIFKSIFSVTSHNFQGNGGEEPSVMKVPCKRGSARNKTNKRETRCYLSGQVFGQKMGVNFFLQEKDYFFVFNSRKTSVNGMIGGRVGARKWAAQKKIAREQIGRASASQHQRRVENVHPGQEKGSTRALSA